MRSPEENLEKLPGLLRSRPAFPSLRRMGRRATGRTTRGRISMQPPLMSQLDMTAAGQFLQLVRGDQNRACEMLKEYRSTLDDDQVKQLVERAHKLSLQLAPLTVTDLREFKVAIIAEREGLLVGSDGEPILTRQSINQAFAFRGLGKTMFGFGLAGSLASGREFLCWKATRPARTLFIEGEMPAKQLQERANLLVPDTDPEYFRLVHLDAQPDNTIRSITSAEGRYLVEEALGDAEVLFLDSISTLANMTTNEEESWLELNDWFKYLRSKHKLCVFYLHHAGKSGLQRGHSK